jgi:hypothetical protein
LVLPPSLTGCSFLLQRKHYVGPTVYCINSKIEGISPPMRSSVVDWLIGIHGQMAMSQVSVSSIEDSGIV